jgi:hypothetical protein
VGHVLTAVALGSPHINCVLSLEGTATAAASDWIINRLIVAHLDSINGVKFIRCENQVVVRPRETEWPSVLRGTHLVRQIDVVKVVVCLVCDSRCISR